MARLWLFLGILGWFNASPSFAGEIFCNGRGSIILGCGFTTGDVTDSAYLSHFTDGIPGLGNSYEELGTVSSAGSLGPVVGAFGRTFAFGFELPDDSAGTAGAPNDFWLDWEGLNASLSDTPTVSDRFVATTGFTERVDPSVSGLDDPAPADSAGGAEAPEPASAFLVAIGLFGVLVRRQVSQNESRQRDPRS